MNNLLKFRQSENQKVYFWGCTHVYHDPKWPIPIWKKRGYSSPEEHSESIRDKINYNLNPSDILVHLGDGFLNSSPEKVESYLQTLTPHIYYFWGNHESSTLRLYQKYKSELYPNLSGVDIYPLTYRNITFLGYYKELCVDGKIIVCQHFPLKIWNNSKQGVIHIHSHNHGGLPSSLPNANDGKILDVGVEVFPNGPTSFDEILKIMDKKDIKSFDSHH